MKNILIVTGGSGGHVIPALSMNDHLKDSFNVTLVTDERGSKFINKDKYKYILIDVPNLFSKLYLFPLNLLKFFITIIKSYIFLRKENINFIISTGGYMSLPFCLGSILLNVKIFLFEPNSVLGRANRLILCISKRIISYNENMKSFPQKFKNKIYKIDAILKKEIYFIKKNKKKEFDNLKKILIIGGSQGAKFFDKNLTEVILKISQKYQIEVVQQVFNKKEKISIEKKYQKLGIKFELFDFDKNFFEKLSYIDLAITRSGASAISELAYLNIPFIAIPFPFSKDNHQYFNAKFYENRNSCWLIEQENFDIEKMSNKITQLFDEKVEYYEKKDNLEKISNQNTWNNVNKKLLNLINEN